MVRQGLPKSIKGIKKKLSKISLKSWIIGGVLLTVVLSYSLVFFIPKTVNFSFADANCKQHLLLAPDLQKFNSNDFDASFEGGLRLGNVNLTSSKVCISPKQTPASGNYTASVSPFGSFFGSKRFNVTVPEAPVARASDIVGKQISTAEPLEIQLTSPDALHHYSLKVADKKSDCKLETTKLSCDVLPLELSQGTKYTAALHQAYKNTDKKILEGEVETLAPLVITSSSITNDQTIYDKPTELTLTFDKPVERGEISLLKFVGDGTEKLEITQEVADATLKVSFGELPRETKFKLDITQVIAENGSSLAEPTAVHFSTSGGPKVATVSVGSSGVSRNARIIVTLDQPLDASVDIAKLARVEGVGGSVAKQSDTQLAFSVQGGDCTPFNLIIDKGLKSGSNGEVSKEAWKFSSRTVCGYSWSIGTSVQGRQIIAHSFGTGSKVILMTAAMHGSEPSSYTTMQAWVQYLQSNPGVIPADKRVVIVPNANPDGLAAGTRNNSRNVNLARNYPTANWQASIDTAAGTLPTGGGTSPGSEPETAALMALTRQLKPRVQISFHAQGSLVGANKFSDSVAIGSIYANTVGYRTMFYNAEAVMGYSMTGEYEGWMGEEMGIPAILIELPRLSGNYFNSQLPALRKMLTL